MSDRPITALCLGGPKHNELMTYPSSWRPYVKVPLDRQPSLRFDPHPSPMDAAFDVVEYETNRIWCPLDKDHAVIVNVLTYDNPTLHSPESAESLTTTMALMMLGRGWVGMDEGERWVIERRTSVDHA